MSDRFAFPRGELRHRTLRGVVITGGFVVLIDLLVLAQGLIVTRVLGPSNIGLYGIVSAVAVSLIGLKKVGIDEAFVAQDEGDQEREFQIAFTLELGLAVITALLIVALSPLVASLWRDQQLLTLMISLAYLPLAFALQAPMWIFLRRMDFARQRSLQAAQPVVGFAVTVPLALAGVGVWSLVIGQAVGYLVAVAIGLWISPYKLKLRFDRAAARRYWQFSAPIAVTAVAALLIAQGQTLSFKLHDGLAAVGFITLAVTLTRYVDRADQIVTASIYPAVCALKEKTRALEELFVKSNRATLLWVLPFSTALILFAPDLQHFLLGAKWHPAVVLVQGMAIATALGQLGFNWFSFYRAYGNNRPAAIESAVGATLFVALAIPGLLIYGATGFVVGRILGVVAVVAIRRYYVHRLLPGVRFATIVRPAVVPLALAVAAALAVRLAAWGDTRTALQAALELALFLAVYAAITARGERQLIAELFASFRDRAQPAQTH